MIWSESMRSLMRSIIAGEPLHEIWADACEDEGYTERAEFVRVQARLHGFDDASLESFPGKEFLDLRRREDEILRHCERDWVPEPLRDLLARSVADHVVTSRRPESWLQLRREISPVQWSRGFVSSITCSWETWLANHRAWWWKPLSCKDCDGHGWFAGVSSIGAITGRKVDCPACHGSGKVEPTDECDVCHGQFVVERPKGSGVGGQGWLMDDCSACICPGCTGKGCAGCHNIGRTGRIPRPCPVEIAMPLECVRLTTLPEGERFTFGGPLRSAAGGSWTAVRFDALTSEWPGLRFEIPGFVGVDPDGRTVMTTGRA